MKKKRQHTIPKCYLENFSDNDGYVWVLDKNNKIFKTNPINILTENQFYSITLKNGEKSLVVEDTLANIEGAYISIFKEKISKDIILTDKEKAMVSVFVAAILLRPKPYREGLRGMIKNLKQWMESWEKRLEANPEGIKVLSSPQDKKNLISLNDLEKYLNNLDEQHSVSIIEGLPEIAQIIFDMKWAILKTEKNTFIASDNPLVLLRPASIKKYGTRAIGSQPGLLYEDVELTLPLSKNRLLLAGWILEKDCYLPVDDEMIKDFNNRTITHSSERIIASSEEELNIIKNKYNYKNN